MVGRREKKKNRSPAGEEILFPFMVKSKTLEKGKRFSSFSFVWFSHMFMGKKMILRAFLILVCKIMHQGYDSGNLDKSKKNKEKKKKIIFSNLLLLLLIFLLLLFFFFTFAQHPTTPSLSPTPAKAPSISHQKPQNTHLFLLFFSLLPLSRQ